MANVINMGGSGANVESKTVKSSQTTQTITPEEGVDGFNPIIVNPFVIQSKTVDPSTSQQVVKPDTGIDGLSQVTVTPVKLQSKTVSPSTSQQIIKPDSSYNGLSQVTINKVNLQSKTIKPTQPQQTVYPDSGYLGLSQVNIDRRLIQGSSYSSSSGSGISSVFSKVGDFESYITIDINPDTTGINLDTDMLEILILTQDSSTGIQLENVGMWIPTLYSDDATAIGFGFMTVGLVTHCFIKKISVRTLQVSSGMQAGFSIVDTTIYKYVPYPS